MIGKVFLSARVQWITADLVDLPLPARAELVAFTADGTEVLLYRYLAEQRAWARLAGPQWRQLLDGVEGIAADQEYFPVEEPLTRLIGVFRDALKRHGVTITGAKQ